MTRSEYVFKLATQLTCKRVDPTTPSVSVEAIYNQCVEIVDKAIEKYKSSN